MFIKYDIRGKYPTEINEATAQFLSKKYVIYLKKKKFKEVFLAQDFRYSSNSLLNSCATVFLQAGFKINYLGIIPTPIYYYYCFKNKKPGVMITASHFPTNYNGFKFFLPSNDVWIYKKIKKIKAKIEVQKIFSPQVKEETYLHYLNQIKNIVQIKHHHYFYYPSRNNSANNFLFNLLPKIFPKIKIIKNSNIFVSSDYDGDRIFIKYKNKIISPEQFLMIILKTGNYKKVGLPITIHKRVKEFFPKINEICIYSFFIDFLKIIFFKYNFVFKRFNCI
jgi:phosphomannomutase